MDPVAERVELTAAPRRARQYALVGALTAALLAVIAYIAITALSAGGRAHHAEAASRALCRQIHGLGQACITPPAGPDTGVEGGGQGQAVEPGAPASTLAGKLYPGALPIASATTAGRPHPRASASRRHHPAGSGTSGDGEAATADPLDPDATSTGTPDPSITPTGDGIVNPGSADITGLRVHDGHLWVVYADGTTVDAGILTGPPPAIVLEVTPGASPAPGSPSPTT